MTYFGYPLPRRRIEAASTGGFVRAAAAGPPAARVRGGATWHQFVNQAPFTTGVVVSERIDVPFVVRHIGLVSNDTLTAWPTNYVRFLVSDDNNTSGGLVTSGTNIFADLGVLLGFAHSSVWADIYPGYVVPTAGKFLKCIIKVGNGLNTFLNFVVDIDYR